MIKKLTNFVIKEQGKCFELARTGRELILLLREDENNEGVEDLLNVRLRADPFNCKILYLNIKIILIIKGKSFLG